MPPDQEQMRFFHFYVPIIFCCYHRGCQSFVFADRQRVQVLIYNGLGGNVGVGFQQWVGIWGVVLLTPCRPKGLLVPLSEVDKRSDGSRCKMIMIRKNVCFF